MIQGSDEWHLWRSQGIGSSDVAAILGVCPYRTARDVCKEKLGLKESSSENFATYRGKKYEDKARALFEIETLEDYPPAVFQSAQFPFMRVSLDGWNESKKEVLEIKVPGKKTIEFVKNLQIPEHYHAQVQYQIFVPDAKSSRFFCLDPIDDKTYTILAHPDEPYIENLILKVHHFWHEYVLKKVLPPPSERDWMEFDEEIQPLLEEYRFSDKKDRPALKEKIRQNMIHPKMQGFGFKCFTTSRGLVIRLDDKNIDHLQTHSSSDLHQSTIPSY